MELLGLHSDSTEEVVDSTEVRRDCASLQSSQRSAQRSLLCQSSEHRSLLFPSRMFSRMPGPCRNWLRYVLGHFGKFSGKGAIAITGHPTEPLACRS